ncbi:MAG: hypothetical protein DMD34_02295 [Gemmatimonadetes bacterium]|nr:MAG: hypothetical protein DMD34_02295 [Gemmatimonadota bacterium]
MAIGRVQGLLAKAAESMERATSSRAPTAELRAAVAVFEQVYKGPGCSTWPSASPPLEAKREETP